MNFVEWLIGILAINFVSDLALSNRTDTNRLKVVGGSPIMIQEVPYLLALHSRYSFMCGGVILSPVWAMSALHCIRGPDDPVKTYYIRVGSSVSIPLGPRYRIRNIHYYSSEIAADGRVPLHDIVLIRLRNRIRFTDKIKPAKLPREGSTPPDMLRVSGWGFTESNSASIRLLAADVPRVSYDDCVSAPPYAETLNEEWHLCYGNNQVDACSGDSGGPLGDSSTVYGIVSFGYGCAVLPGVYVKVSYYRQWIRHITRI